MILPLRGVLVVSVERGRKIKGGFWRNESRCRPPRPAVELVTAPQAHSTQQYPPQCWCSALHGLWLLRTRLRQATGGC